MRARYVINYVLYIKRIKFGPRLSKCFLGTIRVQTKPNNGYIVLQQIISGNIGKKHTLSNNDIL